MNRALMLALLLWEAGVWTAAAQPALPLQLNGLTRLPGFKCGCFALHQPGETGATNFMLTEGEDRFGIRLLKIESALNQVQIEYNGKTWRLHIRSTPILNSAAGSQNAAAGGTSAVLGENGTADNSGPAGVADLSEIVDGNPVIKPAPAGAGGDGANGASPKPDANAPASSDPDPATTLKDQANTDWYQQSLGIEQSRIADAQTVLAGGQTPWPRTPLTPAGTPAALVGDDTLFPSHIPGFYK